MALKGNSVGASDRHPSMAAVPPLLVIDQTVAILPDKNINAAASQVMGLLRRGEETRDMAVICLRPETF